MPITVLMVLSGLFMFFFYNSVMGLAVRAGRSRPFFQPGGGRGARSFHRPHVGSTTRHHLGRRHVFMLPGALIVGPAFYLLFSPPRSLGHAGLFVWLLACSIALRASSAVYRIPYLSLGAELSRDYDDRTSTMAIRTLFGLLGTLGASGAFVSGFLSGDRRRLGTLSCITPATRIWVWRFGALDDRFRPDRHVRHFRLSHLGSGKGSRPGRTSFPASGSPCRTAFRSIWLSTTIFLPGGSAELQHGDSLLHVVRANQPQRGSKPHSDLLLLRWLGGVVMWMSLARRAEKRTLYT
jgi:hypothetical protein